MSIAHAAVGNPPPAGDEKSQPLILRGRGVRFFSGRVRCPFFGLGTRGQYESNRVAVDDDQTTATVDPIARRIVFSNSARYTERTVIGDVLFLADGVTTSGTRTPLALHLKILKKGNRFHCDLHRHLRTAEPLSDAQIEPFEVVLRDGEHEQQVLTAESARRTIARLPFAMRLVKSIMVTRDNLVGVVGNPNKTNFLVADLSMGFGLIGFELLLVRAQLSSLQPLKADPSSSLLEILAAGAWEFRLTALSRKWLTPVIQRDLFVFGLEDLPVLQKVRERGLLPGESLAFRFANNTGSVMHNDDSMWLPRASDVARAYLECHLLGGLLAEHAERRLRRGSAP